MNELVDDAWLAVMSVAMNVAVLVGAAVAVVMTAVVPSVNAAFVGMRPRMRVVVFVSALAMIGVWVAHVAQDGNPDVAAVAGRASATLVYKSPVNSNLTTRVVLVR